MNSPETVPGAARVLVVDDEPDLRTLYELTLLREGHHVDAAGSLAEARERLASGAFDVVITDMRLPDGLGLELLRDLATTQRKERCIMITAYGSAENAVEALKCGAFDYLTKPVDLKQFRGVVASALQAPERAAAAPRATASPAAPAASAPIADATPAVASPAADPVAQGALARLVGDSAAMRAVKHRIAKVARSMAPVLVHGESGTGKELVAGAVHACSHRSSGPFVPVNCGAIPENLLEAEFFGARKGSYTGAAQDREGFFQAARGGTLFLDEIGDLPLAMQAKLLRAIQERRVRALGDTQEEAVDVRIVSATHKDLAAEVHAGRFRQDLFYRLNVIRIQLPTLSERREDIPRLAAFFLQQSARELGMAPRTLSPQVQQHLAHWDWPGNVRQLENVCRWIIVMAASREVHLSDLPLDVQQAPKAAAEGLPGNADNAGTAPITWEHALGQWASNALRQGQGDLLQQALPAFERIMITTALRHTAGGRRDAAQLLGWGRNTLTRKIKELGLEAAAASEHDSDSDNHSDDEDS